MDGFIPADDALLLPADEHASMPIVLAPEPWGFWATIALSVVVLAVWLAAQFAVGIAYGIASVLLNKKIDPAQLTHDGLMTSLCLWAVMPACVGTEILLIKLRPPWTVADYLALRRVSWWAVLGWSFGAIALIAIATILALALGREITPKDVLETYSNATWPPLLWGAMVVAAPVFEESFFRGFMFLGIVRSRLGAAGAVVITAATWAAIHVQYDAYGMSTIFALGILLGIARLKTGSLYPSLAAHAAINLIAVLQIVFLLE